MSFQPSRAARLDCITNVQDPSTVTTLGDRIEKREEMVAPCGTPHFTVLASVKQSWRDYTTREPQLNPLTVSALRREE
jgi:hypothetical protein